MIRLIFKKKFMEKKYQPNQKLLYNLLQEQVKEEEED